jgi:hypothetical protein
MLILLAKASSILPRQETFDVNVQVDEPSDEGLPLEFDVPAEDLVADEE